MYARLSTHEFVVTQYYIGILQPMQVQILSGRHFKIAKINGLL